MIKKLVTWFTKPKDSNRAMIWRELYADVFQNCLKFCAYSVSGSQAMKAENMRAFFDFLNHLVMLGANKSSERLPDINYNYGYGRIKNLAVIVPGLCFFLSGVYNFSTPMAQVFYFKEAAELLTITPASFSLIFLSSFVEFWLFYKNLGNIKEFPASLSFKESLKGRLKLSYDIITQKIDIDPIQNAIAIENVLAVMGVCTPIATSALYYVTNLWWLDPLGQAINGVIQMYLGYLIIEDNSKILIDKSVNEEYMKKVREFISSRNGVLKVWKLKSKYLNSTEYSIAIDIAYDPKKISSSVVEELKSDIEQASKGRSEEEIKQLITKATEFVLVKTDEFNRGLKIEVKQQFPDVADIDIEQLKIRPISKDEYRSS
ncbi:SLC30A9_2 [Blepharisma stoltei]|uniref:Cation efflux protein transmembrane domain-containing protein n=1 Tax=Blepharisma stoltei TaxID=1481888 RepID=A0AAU9IYX8_9CILI|nr:unnamed protein product [Blepharisma stoltei]